MVHSVELFYDYIRDGRIKLREKLKEPTTVQDPCNVVRNGGLAEKNRLLAEVLSEDFRPMKLQGNYNYCCGGGGGNMFRETPEWVEVRISEKRVIEAKETLGNSQNANGAKKVLITACPFCTSMLTDALKTQQLEEEIEGATIEPE